MVASPGPAAFHGLFDEAAGRAEPFQLIGGLPIRHRYDPYLACEAVDFGDLEQVAGCQSLLFIVPVVVVAQRINYPFSWNQRVAVNGRLLQFSNRQRAQPPIIDQGTDSGRHRNRESSTDGRSGNQSAIDRVDGQRCGSQPGSFVQQVRVVDKIPILYIDTQPSSSFSCNQSTGLLLRQINAAQQFEKCPAPWPHELPCLRNSAVYTIGKLRLKVVGRSVESGEPDRPRGIADPGAVTQSLCDEVSHRDAVRMKHDTHSRERTAFLPEPAQFSVDPLFLLPNVRPEQF